MRVRPTRPPAALVSPRSTATEKVSGVVPLPNGPRHRRRVLGLLALDRQHPQLAVLVRKYGFSCGTVLRTAANSAASPCPGGTQERMRAIVRFEERDLLDPRPGRTADEAAAESARSLPAHAHDLRLAARTFDDVHTARTADEPAYRRIEELDTALERTRPSLDTASPGAPS
ncbi:DUF4129 domain-containing protein [Streptomyces narbonensis]